MSLQLLALFALCFQIQIYFVQGSPEAFTLASIINPTFPSYHTAVQLAVEDVNNNPDILPNTILSLDKLTLDIAAEVIEAVIDFSDRNMTLIVGNEYSSLGVLSGVVGNVYGVAQLSGTATSALFSDKLTYPFYSRTAAPGFGQVFIILASLQHYGEVGGRGWTDVALVSTADEYGVDLASSFIENADDYGISILTYQQYLVEDTEFPIELREIEKSKARVIVMLIFLRWDEFVLAANDYGLVGDEYVYIIPDAILGREAFEIPEAEPLSRGLLGTIQYVPETGPLVDAFVERWQNLDPTEYPGAGPGTVPQAFPKLAYDAFTVAAIAADTLDKQGDLEQERIPAEQWTEAIRQVKHEGITGYILLNDVGDRLATFSLSYYVPETHSWELASLWSEMEGLTLVDDVVWYSNSTELPDLDIREPFHYWSCHKGERGYDETGKAVTLHTPDRSDVDEISSHYHCDNFIDCWNLSDESNDCTENYTTIFIVFGIITGLLILVAVFLLIFVLIFGIGLQYHRLRVASPVFLIIMLLSIIVGFASIYAWFGKPHPVACIFQPWLLGLSAISMITALCAKSFRIWRIFRSQLKRQKITDYELIGMWCIIMIPSVLIIVIWMIISTPTAAMRENDGDEHYICTTGGFTGLPGGYIFFGILVAYGAVVLLFGVFLSIVTRNVPSLFNESKLLAISIYNLGFLSAVIIPVFLVIQPINPFIAWILRTVAILYAFTATMILQFSEPVIRIIIIDRFSNNSVDFTLKTTSTNFDNNTHSSS